MRKKINLFFWCIVLTVSFISCFNLSVLAQELDLGNLIMDQTRTNIGSRFYRNFSEIWQWPNFSQEMLYDIYITEMSMGWGFRIIVELGDFDNRTVVYRKLLKPNTKIEEEVKIAANAAKNYLYQLYIYQYSNNLKKERGK